MFWQIRHHAQGNGVVRRVFARDEQFVLRSGDIQHIDLFRSRKTKPLTGDLRALAVLAQQHAIFAGPAGSDGNQAWVGVVFHQVSFQIAGQCALEYRPRIHGIAGRNADEKDVAHQKREHHPLFVQHFSNHKSDHARPPASQG